MAAGTLHLDDYKRYGRQMILDGIGLPGQLKLQQAAVVVIGAGGLGCPALQYLVAAGVGRIGIIDHDVVELSNLQRQTLHTESRLGMPKAESAARALIQFRVFHGWGGHQYRRPPIPRLPFCPPSRAHRPHDCAPTGSTRVCAWTRSQTRSRPQTRAPS